MFFLRDVFDKAGIFRKGLGAETDFPLQEMEIAFRASARVFTGVLPPDFIAQHHHGCKLNSSEVLRTIEHYDVGRFTDSGPRGRGRVEYSAYFNRCAALGARPAGRWNDLRLEDEIPVEGIGRVHLSRAHETFDKLVDDAGR